MTVTELQLNEDLISIAEGNNKKLPKEFDSRQIKFDPKGSLNILYRNEEGKFLGNTVITQKSNNTYSDKVQIVEEVEELVQTNKQSNILFTVICVSLVVATLFTVLLSLGLR